MSLLPTTTNVRKVKSRMSIGSGGIMFLFATALILGAAIYTQANLLFWSFGLMIGAMAVSVLASWQALRGVRVQRLLPGHGVAGEPLVIRYQITNRAWLPVFSLIISETWGRGGRGWKKTGPLAARPRQLKGRPYGWVLHLGPNQTVQAEAVCWPLLRSAMSFERIVLSSAFPFGVLRKVVEFEQKGEVLVYPHLYRMNRRVLFKLSRVDPIGRKQIERSGGNEEFFGLRDYRAGDSLKMIDWKHTARTGELVAKEMTQPSPPRLMVLLDLRVDGVPDQAAPAEGKKQSRRRVRHTEEPELSVVEVARERAISLAASVVCDAYLHGYQVGLAIVGPTSATFPLHHSLPHRTRMLEALARLDFSRPIAEPDMLPARPTVVVTTGAADGGSARGDATVLGAADLEQYVLEADAAGLLRQQMNTESRRMHMEEAAAEAEAS